MTIAVHISLGDAPDDVRSEYNYHCFSQMALQEPAYHFIFIFDKPFSPALIGSSNITPVLLGPALKNRLLKHYWYQFKLPRLLARYQADHYVNQDKMICLRTDTPQMMIMEDLAFMHRSTLYNRQDRHYLKKYLPAFIKKTALIALMNASLKETIEKRYPASAGKTIILPSFIRPRDKTAGEELLRKIDTLTEGRAYFVFLATALTKQHIITALKAFSIFKKWQQSNMQFLILPSSAAAEWNIEGLPTYKYRDQVRIHNPEDRQEFYALLSAAYAVIYLSAEDFPEKESLETLACEVPLICADSPFQQSRHGGAAVYTAITETALSDKMMRLYKDESMRSELIDQAKQLAAASSPERAVSLLRNALTG